MFKFKSSVEGFTDESLFVPIEHKWSSEHQLLCQKKHREEAIRVSKHIAAYLHRNHRKDVLGMFTSHYQTEAKNCFWDSNDGPLCSDKKAAQDAIDEKPFA